ncbi:hypothetical protein WAX87_01770 [Photobacterium damselae subsp. damselae]|uniref:hypothetical protein n=1 Tax=Photobacterium damselae TaxID=38293 RepID=UPI000D06FA9E|nr:hypothetical protein [Photobacterium damselae]PSB82997.1 hypothetical protein C5F62_08610 [Photobacterium damselae subsp. damselae]TGZ34020.1 hypothetical protein EQ875_02586 [Photobacterium damselae subsp. damselae]
MGGDSSSSSSSTNVTTNTSGQNGISGDNTGAAISGVNNSTISVSTTDHGSIEMAGDVLNQALEEIGKVSDSAIDGVNDANERSAEAIKDVNDKSLSFASDTLDRTLDTVNSSISVTKDLAMQTSSNSRYQMQYAKDMLSDFISSSENLMTNGQSQQTNSNTKIIQMLLLVSGVVMGIYFYRKR